MNTIKHFAHKTMIAGQGGELTPFAVGRMAVGVVDGDRFVVRQLSGAAPRPNHMILALQQFPELLQRANEAARTRRAPYFVEVRQTSFGAVNYLLREYRDEAVADYPICSRLHVSCAGVLNEGVNVWVGDLGALLKPWLERTFDPDDDLVEVVEEVPIFDKEGIRWEVKPTILTITYMDGHKRLSVDAVRESDGEEALFLGAEVRRALAALDE